MAVRLRPLLVAVAALAFATGAAACGTKEEVRTTAATEGPYLDVGPLQYQVQISRQLNPADEEDSGYFVGVPNATGQLKPDETWFGVFVKAFNSTDHTYTGANEFEIEDTVGKRYKPVDIGPENAFAYRAVAIPGGGQFPAVDSLADDGVVGGSLLLFKLTVDSLANRPLVLHIKSAKVPHKEATVDLDV